MAAPSRRIRILPFIPMKARVLSGMQPTGNLHIGNYLGALKNWVKIQHDYECIFCIVDLHAITVHQEPKELQAKITEIAALYLGRRNRPGAFERHGAVRRARARGAGLDADLRHAGRLAGADDAVQGESRPRRNRSATAAAVSGPDGGRHPALSGRDRAGRRRSVAASGTDARHRAALQFALRRDVHDAVDQPADGRGARHGARRSHGQDEQVRRGRGTLGSAARSARDYPERRFCAPPRIRIRPSISKRPDRASPIFWASTRPSAAGTRTRCRRTSPACVMAI